jgi:DNA-binding CsgD family transcriptional regulator
VEKLETLCENDYSYKKISEKLDRTVGSVKMKIYKLDLHKKRYNTWNEQEVEKLKQLVKEGYSDKNIAKKMNRTVGSIIGKKRSIEINLDIN